VKVECWFIGKTAPAYLESGLSDYAARIGKYVPFQMVVLPEPKDSGRYPPEKRLLREGEQILQKLDRGDVLILLDERGKSFSSSAFAGHLEKELNRSVRKLIFVAGGSFGFSQPVYDRAEQRLSLSPMTFSHQMVRLFFLEQLYRAFTLLRNEPYHHS